MKIRIVVFFILGMIIIPSVTYAQNERKEIREGNDKYEKGKYSDAETDYRRALEKNRSSYPGNYNLGGALYRQKKFDEAIQQYQQTIDKSEDPEEKAQTYHNMGNALLQAQKYDESVQAYKEALKLNPADADTRYNLAYAQAMLKKQQQQQQQNKDSQDQNKDQQKNKDQQQQAKDQKQDNKEQDKQEQQKEQANKQPKISKEDAERILQALKNDEQNLQEKLSKKEGQRIRIDKNW
ncbi:MAG: tetratricopeptide repeat protein [Bacteroidota bacterium]|nr:tetratricopeptide repeat protein [Bacteroidota bacterium]